MINKNPTQVQYAPCGLAAEARKRVPLVLIHDGGGTVFGYHILGDLERDAWALHNPRLFSGEPWESMDEMAEHYIGLLVKAGICGHIILGGWSLGGLLSVTMARKLAQDPSPNITVDGFLIIDTPFHIPWNRLPTSLREVVLDQSPEMVRKCYANLGPMLAAWELPQWEHAAGSSGPVRFDVGDISHDLPAHQMLYKALGDDKWKSLPAKPFANTANGACSHVSSAALPPAVLVRCARAVPKRKQEDGISRVDIFRHEVSLGWDGRYPNFIRAVIDTEAHHLDVFELSKARETTKKLITGLEILDSLEAMDVRLT